MLRTESVIFVVWIRLLSLSPDIAPQIIDTRIYKTDIQFWAVSGPLHVLWQIFFGCWVMWSISSWQEYYYKSVFFFNFRFLNDKSYRSLLLYFGVLYLSSFSLSKMAKSWTTNLWKSFCFIFLRNDFWLWSLKFKVKRHHLSVRRFFCTSKFYGQYLVWLENGEET